MLQPLARDATSDGEGCYNQQTFLLEPTTGVVAEFLFAGTGVFICWNRLIVLFQQTMELLFAENFLLEPALIFPGTG